VIKLKSQLYVGSPVIIDGYAGNASAKYNDDLNAFNATLCVIIEEETYGTVLTAINSSSSLTVRGLAFSGFLYPLTLVPEGVRPWVAANPFNWVVGRLRDGLLEGRLSLQPSDALAVAISIALFVAGRWVFRRLSPHFEDFV